MTREVKNIMDDLRAILERTEARVNVIHSYRLEYHEKKYVDRTANDLVDALTKLETLYGELERS